EAGLCVSVATLAVRSWTVDKYSTFWLTDVATPRLRATTGAGYRRVIRGHLVPALGRKRGHRLSPQDIRALLGFKRRSGLSARMVQYIDAVLGRCHTQRTTSCELRRRGACQATVAVDCATRPGVAFTYKAYWARLSPDRVNVNAVTAVRDTDLGGGPT